MEKKVSEARCWKSGHRRPTSGATTAAPRRPSSRVPGSAALGKLCRNPGSQGLDEEAGRAKPSLRSTFASPFSPMLLKERTLLTRFFVLFSNPGVSPRGAWSQPCRRMLINFGLSLQTWAEWQLASVTPLSSDCLILFGPHLEDPLCPAPFSGVGTRGSRRALHPAVPHPNWF